MTDKHNTFTSTNQSQSSTPYASPYFTTSTYNPYATYQNNASSNEYQQNQFMMNTMNNGGVMQTQTPALMPNWVATEKPKDSQAKCCPEFCCADACCQGTYIVVFSLMFLATAACMLVFSVILGNLYNQGSTTYGKCHIDATFYDGECSVEIANGLSYLCQVKYGNCRLSYFDSLVTYSLSRMECYGKNNTLLKVGAVEISNPTSYHSEGISMTFNTVPQICSLELCYG
eukprot:TRINITY_DN4175_c0_g1_i1.p1 TRINITY_DN4175_c0_g1~~TRINITY_DN4175_c0_g1_i1.p1  ORF type:complete len:244 (+),score=23.12 TRINITY_DN4175_c0_g1_i1:46-732(+)